MRRACAVLAALTLMAALGGCSAVGTDTYSLTAYFAETPSLYEKSRVKVMGANVGTIDEIEIDRATQKVKVTFSVRGDVPVPADAHAAVMSASTIGERNIVLYPAWEPGMARMAPGTAIPEERTDLPVEIDDALASFSTLSRSIDPESSAPPSKAGPGCCATTARTSTAR